LVKTEASFGASVVLFNPFCDYHLLLQKKLKNPKPSLVPAIAWLVISIILLTLPGTAFPEETWLDKIWFDKWVHIGMFSILVTLWCWGWRSIKNNYSPGKLKSIFIIIAISFTGYGIVMEFVQLYFIPHRSFDIGDIIADASGSLIGVLFSTWRYVKK
jgi:hypothetical protein